MLDRTFEVCVIEPMLYQDYVRVFANFVLENK